MLDTVLQSIGTIEQTTFCIDRTNNINDLYIFAWPIIEIVYKSQCETHSTGLAVCVFQQLTNYNPNT